MRDRLRGSQGRDGVRSGRVGLFCFRKAQGKRADGHKQAEPISAFPAGDPCDEIRLGALQFRRALAKCPYSVRYRAVYLLDAVRKRLGNQPRQD